MSLVIGNWIKRGRKWHLVESVVAGDVITRCGRRMRDGRPFQVSDVMPLTRLIDQPQLCKAGCDREPLPEDDGSTHNETVP